MRTEREINYLRWMLSEDPHAEMIQRFLNDYRESLPMDKEVSTAIKAAEMLYEGRSGESPADLSVMTGIAKTLFLTAWLYGWDDTMKEMNDQPYTGWVSVFKKIMIFKEAYAEHKRKENGEAEETTLGSV